MRYQVTSTTANMGLSKMSKIVDLIESKDLVTAKSLFSEKIESFKKLKLLEMKKIVMAKLYNPYKEDKE